MTDRTPPPAALAARLHPFGQRPGRWKRERSRAVRGGHICRSLACTDGCEPVLIRERTRWGFLDWTVPADGSLPERAHRIGVLAPAATRGQHLAFRWLSRRPAGRIGLTARGSVRNSTAAVAILALAAAGVAISHGVALSVVLPALLLAPLLVEHLPDRLDARAAECTRILEDEAACHYLQRLAALHTYLAQAAASSHGDLYQVRRAAEIGHHQLFDAADVLMHHDTRSVSDQLIARERLLVQLTTLVAQLLPPTGTDAAGPHQPGVPTNPLGPYPPGSSRAHPPTGQTHPTPHR